MESQCWITARFLNTQVEEKHDVLRNCTAALRDNTVQNLTLRYSELEDKDIRSISDALAVNTSLKNLGMGPLDWYLLIGLLCQLDPLSLGNMTLLLEYNVCADFSDNIFGDSGTRALANALAGNTTLLSLNLSENYISERGARALSKWLSQNTTLQFLDLFNNRLASFPAMFCEDFTRFHKAGARTS